MTLQDIIGKRIAVHCRTKDEQARFLRMCEDNGVVWLTMTKPFSWPNAFNGDTYSLSTTGITNGEVETHIRLGYTIIPFTDLTDNSEPKPHPNESVYGC